MPTNDRLAAWDFELPAGQIASHPREKRTDARLLHLPLGDDSLHHRGVRDLPRLLRPGDRLVVNDTKVMACRLRARRATGGAVELLLLTPGPNPVPALARPAKKLRRDDVLTLEGGGTATVVHEATDGVVQVQFSESPVDVMERQGSLPLPPYLGRDAAPDDAERYQTVYAGPLGSAAAPTAGLHFDDALLSELDEVGVGLTRVTLHVGLGTFRPLREEDLDAGTLHVESIDVSETAAHEIGKTKSLGGRIVAVGTTSARTLESATPAGATSPEPTVGTTDLFIRPPHEFRCVDGLMTNFHLPRSSLLMLVAAMVGRERMFTAYDVAVREGYRFYSYGDAMLLL